MVALRLVSAAKTHVLAFISKSKCSLFSRSRSSSSRAAAAAVLLKYPPQQQQQEEELKGAAATALVRAEAALWGWGAEPFRMPLHQLQQGVKKQ